MDIALTTVSCVRSVLVVEQWQLVCSARLLFVSNENRYTTWKHPVGICDSSGDSKRGRKNSTWISCYIVFTNSCQGCGPLGRCGGHDPLKICRRDHPMFWVSDSPKSALFSLSIPIFVHKLSRSWYFRRLIPKSAFMHFLAILTFLHIWKDKSQGYLKMQGPWQFLQNKGV